MEAPKTRIDRTAQARAEAERQWPSLSHLTQAERAAWKACGRWADANPKPHTIHGRSLRRRTSSLRGGAMTDVDAIMADGLYADRKGRWWRRSEWLYGSVEWLNYGSSGPYALTPAQMRTLIECDLRRDERDFHHDECPGLRYCNDHPVPQVVCFPGLRVFTAYGPNSTSSHDYPTHEQALDAARHMTGEQK